VLSEEIFEGVVVIRVNDFAENIQVLVFNIVKRRTVYNEGGKGRVEKRRQNRCG